MSLLAEEIVEEWLNRQGYFTIRGVKIGVHEIDLLAIKPRSKDWECRHIEVQASVRPVSYVTRVPREIQKQTGRAAGSAKHRLDGEVRQGVAEWIQKKYNLPSKQKLMQRLCPGTWTRELVVHIIKHEEEIQEIQRQGVTVHRLRDVVRQIIDEPAIVEGAVSGDVFDLLTLFKDEQPGT